MEYFFSYTLSYLFPKISENVFCFQGVETGCIGNKWGNTNQLLTSFTLLFNSSGRGTILDTATVFSLFYKDAARSIVAFAI